MYGILAWVVIGALAGWLASRIMKTRKRQGLLTNIAVGVIGAFVGGYVVDLLDIGTGAGTTITGFNLPSLVTATFGAVILLALLKFIRR